jgi:hypothetical protein
MVTVMVMVMVTATAMEVEVEAGAKRVVLQRSFFPRHLPARRIRAQWTLMEF